MSNEWDIQALPQKICLSLFDDILVCSRTWELHLVHLKIVFELLQSHTLYVKQSKCAFGQAQVEYLGHIVSNEWVATNPSKLDAIANWHVPTSVKALRRFLGLRGYYRKFIPDFGKIIGHLTVLSSHNNIQYTQASYDFSSGIGITRLYSALYESDASGFGIGVVLQKNGRPIAFTNKALSVIN